MDEVGTLEAQRQDIPFFVVDVRTHRPLSQQIATRSGVTHESPQVIVFRSGAPAWTASHSDVTAAQIAPHLPPT